MAVIRRGEDESETIGFVDKSGNEIWLGEYGAYYLQEGMVAIFKDDKTGYMSISTTPAQSNVTQATGASEDIYAKINEARAAASKPGIARSEGLESIAAAYADVLCGAGAEFRKNTDFTTLPNGERVITLAASATVSGFSYSVFFGKNPTPETTDEFRGKVVDGDFTRVGVASVSGADGSYVTVIVYDKS